MDLFSDVIGGMRGGRKSFCRTRGTGRWGRRLEPFSGTGFHVVLDGGGWLVTPSAPPVRLDAGDVVFVPYGAAHGLSGTPDRPFAELPAVPDAFPPEDGATSYADVVCGAYRSDKGQAHPFLQGLPDVIHMRSDRHSAMRTVVDLLADGPESGVGAGAAVPALIDLLLVYLLRAWHDDAGPPAALGDPAVAAALHRIHRDPRHKWTVEELGAAVGMSRTAFARRFTSLVGLPPVTYLTNWRLDCGARLLRETDAPLASIAHQVGYSSEFAFASAFRRRFGTPPGRFRHRERAFSG
ncbi:AraC family transcriptional regulator [Planomonospora sp. ID91781]|uniref:AraC family transcriptional regulator n=1 Tax=Planomonospora sp. ID91781 TaxID=2738135 RepID=UPI0018C3E524|nr:AraC family transcriptional regulator [Planomonospora sp. ID91781]MBG0820058.1 AraC family transcriptional regulator [Planomonospora sp. ID91781]